MDDMKAKVRMIWSLPLKSSIKIKLLNDLIIDCLNEMEAQEENMRPEIEHNLAEGFRTAKDCLRKLQHNRLH